MLKKFSFVVALFLVLSLSTTLQGNESTETYFPSTIGSFWVYEDQDGNELTRTVIEGEEIADEIFHGFSYDPELEDWTNFQRYMYPALFNIGEEWTTFLVGEEIEKAVKTRLTKEMDTFSKLVKHTLENNFPVGLDITVDLSYKVSVEAEERFNLFPAETPPDEEWDATQISAKIVIEFDIQGLPEVQNAEDMSEITLEFTIAETGKLLSTETVETAAGTFEDCLKIEYRTETNMTSEQPTAVEDPPGESVTTVWLAPEVGIVKFHQESEKIFLNMMAERDLIEMSMSEEEAAEFTAASVKTFELKKYEIVSDTSQDDSDK